VKTGVPKLTSCITKPAIIAALIVIIDFSICRSQSSKSSDLYHAPKCQIENVQASTLNGNDARAPRRTRDFPHPPAPPKKFSRFETSNPQSEILTHKS
jgi:hypothetical protein